MNNVPMQLVRMDPINATFLFFVQDGKLKCAHHNDSPAPSPYPIHDATVVYEGEILSFGVVRHNTAALECVIETPNQCFLVFCSRDNGRSWKSKSAT